MAGIEDDFNELKTKVANIEAKVNEISTKWDAGTDTVLGKIVKSSVSWLIVAGYTFGVFTLGAVLF